MKKLILFISILSAMLLPWRAAAQVTDTTRLVLQAINPNNFASQLTWNNIGEGVTYQIFRKLPTENGYSLRASTQQHILLDTVERIICYDTVAYYLTCHRDDTLFVSNKIGLLFQDPYPTTVPELRVVSVDEESQKIHFSWNPSPDADILGYFICHIEEPGAPCMGLDTVWGRENCEYIAENLSATQVQSFRVYAFDSCFTASPLTDNCNNIVLDIDIANCQRTATARWNAYINMPSGVDKYLLMVRYGSGSYLPVDSVTSSDGLALSFDVPEWATETAFKIAAKNNDGTLTAFSNTVHHNFTFADTAQYVRINHADINENASAVTLYCSVDPLFETARYYIYRKVGNRNYSCIAEIPYSSSGNFKYTDENVTPSSRCYSYRIGVFDACEGEQKYSHETTPLYLKMETLADGNLEFHWNRYRGEGFNGEYHLLRKNEGDSLWNIVWSGTDTSSTEYISDQVFIETQHYQIVALLQHDALGADSARSNQQQYYREATVWAPDVFTPDQSENNRFCLSFSFLQASDFSLRVYNRQGQQVFSSTNPTECWDGTNNGRKLPQGVYTYIAFCQHADQTSKYYKGTILLLR